MSANYNSKLIIALVLANDPDDKRILELIEEMSEINDPIFLYPLFETYKKFKTSSISHYFISAIAELEAEDKMKILLEIVEDPELRSDDLIWTLNEITQQKTIPPIITQKIQSIIFDFISHIDNPVYKNKIESYELTSLLAYLIEQDIDKVNLQNNLKKLWQNTNADKGVKSIALKYYLKALPKESFKQLIIDYPEYIDTKTELIIVKEIVTWHGPQVDVLIQMIRDTGSQRAKEIINESFAKKETEQAIQEQEEIERYGNGKMIEMIGDLRNKINMHCESDKKINNKIFCKGELLYTQIKTVRDKPTLVLACTSLRVILDAIEEELRHSHSEEDIKRDFAEIDYKMANSGFNRLYVCLRDNGINVPFNLYGLRKIDRAVNLLLHPEEELKLIPILTELGLSIQYKNEKWAELHTGLLMQYQNALTDLLVELKK